MLILSTIPYLLFKENGQCLRFLSLSLQCLGLSNDGTCNDRRESIQCIEKKELLFDQNFLKELTKRYAIIKKKYAAVMIVGFCFIAAGAIPFYLRKTNYLRRTRTVLSLLCCTYCYRSLSFCSCVRGVRDVSDFSRK